MDNSKRCGFTLSEILMALAIVGVIGLLVIPGTVRGMQNKARVSLLKNTVANIGTAIKTELVKNRTSDITLTDIYKDPKTFLETMDLSSKVGSPFAESYKNYSGSAATVDIPSNSLSKQGAVRLKSGVSVGIINNDDNTTSLVVDLTGPDKPNIVGADLFIMNIAREDGDGHSSGDIIFQAPNCNSDYATACKNGDGASCFALVVRSSYDEDYLNKEITCRFGTTANGYKIGKRSDPTTWEAFKITQGLSYDECESIKADLGIQNCSSKEDDLWAAAVKECGGVQNMLTDDDLTALALTLYPDCSIIYDNAPRCNSTLDTSKIPENLSGLGSDYKFLWSSSESGPDGAYVRYFSNITTVKIGDYSRRNPSFKAVCVSDL